MHEALERRALARATVSLVPLIAQKIELKVDRAHMRGPCPYHLDPNQGLHVDPRNQIFHCYSCGSDGDVVDWTMQLEGVDEDTAIQLLLGERMPPET